MIVAKSKETTVIPAIAHEYTHLILAKLEIPNEYNYLEEGLARKIQRDISIKYKEKLNNLLFEYDILNYDVGEMKSVYKWICDLLEKEPRKELLKVKARETDWIEKRYYNNHDKPTPHAIGNTTFKIMQEINYEVASYEASQFAKIFLSEKAYLKIISTN